MIEEIREIRVELGRDGFSGGPLYDGRRPAEEFGFQAPGLRERLASSRPHQFDPHTWNCAQSVERANGMLLGCGRFPG